MPRDLLGPTLEDVQMWLRSASGWVSAGFVLNVEPVNARLGRVLVVEDDPGIATQLVRGLTRAGYETGSVTTGKAALDWPHQPVMATAEGMVPAVFRVDLSDPASFFLIQNFPIENRDILYVSNAPITEIQKFLNVLFSVAYPALAIEQAGGF